MRYGYAVEYDYICPSELEYTPRNKKAKRPILSRTNKWTSGYEEAKKNKD